MRNDYYIASKRCDFEEEGGLVSVERIILDIAHVDKREGNQKDETLHAIVIEQEWINWDGDAKHVLCIRPVYSIDKLKPNNCLSTIRLDYDNIEHITKIIELFPGEFSEYQKRNHNTDVQEFETFAHDLFPDLYEDIEED